MNEVVNNSIKHAFPDNKGEIDIVLSRGIDDWNLMVRDNGIGVEDIEQLDKNDSFGIEIIRALTEQLDGSLKIISSPNEGMKFSFSFPS
ncbi:MAG: sensor histidine kinase [Flavobacteriales bacterium]|nr:sensor histidine kinase [Flavobacteriales bacterium]